MQNTWSLSSHPDLFIKHWRSESKRCLEASHQELKRRIKHLLTNVKSHWRQIIKGANFRIRRPFFIGCIFYVFPSFLLTPLPSCKPFPSPSPPPALLTPSRSPTVSWPCHRTILHGPGLAVWSHKPPGLHAVIFLILNSQTGEGGAVIAHKWQNKPLRL